MPCLLGAGKTQNSFQGAGLTRVNIHQLHLICGEGGMATNFLLAVILKGNILEAPLSILGKH